MTTVARDVLIVLASAGLLACTEPEQAAPLTRGAIVSGAPDVVHVSVGAIGVRRTACSEALVSFCSGTLIAPDVVLTAAHCFRGRAPWEVYEVMFGADTRRAGSASYVTRVELHPSFDDATHRADVALLRLSAPVAVTPARLPSAGAFSARVSDPVTVVGFGVASATEPDSGGQRRAGTSKISEIAAATFSVTPGPGLSCLGDSGGALFVEDGEGPLLVGVTNAGDPGCRLDAVNARVDAFVSGFIRPFVSASPAPPATRNLALLCSSPCQTAADCPAGLACIPAATSGGYCGLGGMPPASYGEECLFDGACASGTCARLAHGAERGACRCHQPCAPPVGSSFDGGSAGSPPATAGPGGATSGCAIAPARHARGAWLVILAFGAALGGRLRRRYQKETTDGEHQETIIVDGHGGAGSRSRQPGGGVRWSGRRT